FHAAEHSTSRGARKLSPARSVRLPGAAALPVAAPGEQEIRRSGANSSEDHERSPAQKHISFLRSLLDVFDRDQDFVGSQQAEFAAGDGFDRLRIAAEAADPRAKRGVVPLEPPEIRGVRGVDAARAQEFRQSTLADQPVHEQDQGGEEHHSRPEWLRLASPDGRSALRVAQRFESWAANVAGRKYKSAIESKSESRHRSDLSGPAALLICGSHSAAPSSTRQRAAKCERSEVSQVGGPPIT